MSTYNHSEVIEALASLTNLDKTATLVHLRNTVHEGHMSQKNTALSPGLDYQAGGVITGYGSEVRTAVILKKGDALYLTTKTEDEFKMNSEFIFIYQGDDKFEGLMPSFAQFEFDPATKQFTKLEVSETNNLPFSNPNEVLDNVAKFAGDLAKQLKEGEHLRLLAIQEDIDRNDEARLIALAKSNGFYTGIEVLPDNQQAVLTNGEVRLEVTEGLYLYFVIFSDEKEYTDLKCVGRQVRREGAMQIIINWSDVGEDKPNTFPPGSHAADHVASMAADQNEPELGTTAGPDAFKKVENILDSVQISQRLTDLMTHIRRQIPRSQRLGIVIDKTGRPLDQMVESVLKGNGDQYQTIEFNAIHKVAMLVRSERSDDGQTVDFRRIKVEDGSHIFFVTDSTDLCAPLAIVRHAAVQNGTLRRAIYSGYPTPEITYAPFVGETDVSKAMTGGELTTALSHVKEAQTKSDALKDFGIGTPTNVDDPEYWKSSAEETDVTGKLNKALDELVKPPIGPSDSELLNMAGFGSPEVS